ncbi:MAG: hypothetical protein KC933_24395, partial [Myxococcales bacterium]|nr:hypothetical protein [Myxococcales bacterium]
MILNLLGKELRQHRGALVFAALLSAAQFVLLLQFFVQSEEATLLRASTAFTYGAGPILAAFTARRLFVLELESGTIHLLRALPVSPVTLTVTKAGLALCVNLAVNLGLLALNAAMVQGQELAPWSWVLRLGAQVASYTFAWVAVTLLLAHLGSYRYVAWLVVFMLLTSLDDVFHDPNRYLFWTAPLSDAIDATRYVTPWDGVALAVLWGVAAFGAMFFLAGFRGGARVDAWYAPFTGRQRARVTAGAFLVLVGFELLTDLGAHRGADPGGLPKIGRIELAATELAPLATRLDAELNAIQAAYDLGPLPTVILAPRDRPGAAAASTLATRGGALLVGVDTTRAEDMVHLEALTDVLMGHGANNLVRNPYCALWGRGLGAWWLVRGGEPLPDLLVRAGARIPDGISLFGPADAVEQAAGDDGVKAAGALAWQALEAVDPAAATTLAHALVGPRRTLSGGGLLRAMALAPQAILQDAGVDTAAVEAEWHRRLAALRGSPGRALPAPRLEEDDTGPVLAWDLPEAVLAEHRVELWWAVQAPLRKAAIPAGDIDFAR